MSRTNYNNERDPIKGGPPDPLAVVHLVEYRVPLSSTNISSVVLIEAFPWTAVVAPYFQSLPDF